MSCKTLFIDTDNPYTVEGVRDKLTGAYINDATVTLTLVDDAGDELTGQAWPLTLTYVTGSDGNYVGTIQDTVKRADGEDLEDHDNGLAIIDIDGGGLQAHLELEYEYVTYTGVYTHWTSRDEIEAMFGLINVSKWGDLEGDQDEDDIATRVEWAVLEATEDARMRLALSPAAGLECAPRPLRIATTRLAGVLLYESRGIADTSNEDGSHRLTVHKREADKFFQKVQAGLLFLGESTVLTPHVMDETEEEECDDPFAAV